MKSTLKFLNLAALVSICVSCSDSSSNSNSNFTIYSSNSSVSTLILPRALSGSPTSLILQIYALYISPNADCTNAVRILNNGNTPQPVDVYAANTLFSGVVTANTYNCIAIEMSDVISYRVDATAVTDHSECVSTSTTHTGDLYRDGESDDGLWKNTIGTGIDATGSFSSPSADRIFTFATTSTSAAISGSLGLHPNQLLDLTSPLVVPGSATFFADFTDGIEGNGGVCAIEGGAGFGFR